MPDMASGVSGDGWTNADCCLVYPCTFNRSRLLYKSVCIRKFIKLHFACTPENQRPMLSYDQPQPPVDPPWSGGTGTSSSGYQDS